MKLKELQQDFREVKWPTSSNDLPILTWEQFVDEANKKNGRDLIVIGGFIHDVTEFIDEHPGGRALIKTRLGKDATTAFHGGVYGKPSHPFFAFQRDTDRPLMLNIHLRTFQCCTQLVGYAQSWCD
jgi:cytochrome b involved in lipid metabolism